MSTRPHGPDLFAARPPARQRTPGVLGDLGVAAVLAVTSSLLLAWLSSSGGTARELLVLGLERTGFALPLLALAVPFVAAVGRATGRSRTERATAVGATVAVVTSAANQVRTAFWPDSGAEVAAVAFVADSAALLLPCVLLAALMAHRSPAAAARRAARRRIRYAARLLTVTGSALAVVGVGLLSVPAGATAAPTAAAAVGAGCFDGGQADRWFDVVAVDVDIPLNRYGDHDTSGKMFVLTNRLAAVREQERTQKVSGGLHGDAIQPLVVRANIGECVEVTYLNDASGGDFGLHIEGLQFSPVDSGNTVGANASAAVPRGSTRVYRFSVPDDLRSEGAHYLHPGPGYRAAVNHGLFGSLVVEPAGSTYWDPADSSKPLESGWEAIVKPSSPSAHCTPTAWLPTCAFREGALLHHEVGNDNEVIQTSTGADAPLVDDVTGTYRPGAFALNYRSEPFRNRLLDYPKEKSHSYSSYVFGDPATPIMRGYLSDPTKIRLLHAGGEKFHVYHLHGGGDRWRFDPASDQTFDYQDTGLRKDTAVVESPSQRLDSQAFGPGESYNLEIEGGAGGVQQSVGDFLFHCHIAKHYTSGMWGMWRVFDTLQPDLATLRDRPEPPRAVTSAGLIGRTYNGVKITKDNLDSWIRPQLPPSGVPKSAQDATVWNWKVAGSLGKPLYLGAPADLTSYVNSAGVVPGQPNLLAVDAGNVKQGRPAILFNPVNGRPAYPLLRTHIGGRPPFTPAGHGGAPYLGADADRDASGSVDPWAGRVDGLCPKGRETRTFNVVAIGTPVRRTPTFVDPLGKVFTLAKDKAKVRADPDKVDPLAIRANAGDCVGVTLTNEIPDADAFDHYSKVTMHIHHVQFDVQGSDGVSAGFAYEHSVRPYAVVDPRLVTAVAPGASTLRLSSVTQFVGADANGKPRQPWIAVGEGLESIEVRQVVSVDRTARTVTLGSPLSSAHAAAEYVGTEFVRYRWYPDAVLDNIFWHDHVDGIHGWGHGLVGQLIVEPKGSTYHDPSTGAEVDSGTIVDIRTPGVLAPGVVESSFRELALFAVNDNDKSDYSTFNLRSNPLVDRPDSANQFSSWRYGDPLTPLPRLYPGDPLVVRSINVSPTVDSLHLVGGRTNTELRRPDATVVDTVHAGVSERFSLVFNGTGDRLDPGDYLYANGIELRTRQGAWGVVRVLPGQVGDLQPLPGLTPDGSFAPPTPTGGPPPPSAGPGDPCPTGAPTRSFNLTALDRSGSWSNSGRTAYVPDQDVADVLARRKAPQPLVLHVVAGECVTVRLTNSLTTPVGFAVGELDRAQGSGGVNVGYNPEQNTMPGQSRGYTYYVPTDRIGSASISDLASSSRSKAGLYGVVVVAPASTVDGQATEFSDPVTGAARDVGAQVLVHAPGHTPVDYRDFTVLIADDDPQIGQDFMPYPTNANAGKSVVNYTSAPVGDGPTAFRNAGAVPRLTAYADDPMLVHVLVSPGSESTHSVTLGGLSWPQDRFVKRSGWRTNQGMAPWETYDLEVVGGAGGGNPVAGDYFYGDVRRPFTQIGLWGLQRVLPAGSCASSLRRVDGSRC